MEAEEEVVRKLENGGGGEVAAKWFGMALNGSEWYSIRLVRGFYYCCAKGNEDSSKVLSFIIRF